MKKEVDVYICEVEDCFFEGSIEQIQNRLINFKTEIHAIKKRSISLNEYNNFKIKKINDEEIGLFSTRIETDDEYNARIQRDSRILEISDANKRAQEIQEKQLLADLKAKYESKDQ